MLCTVTSSRVLYDGDPSRVLYEDDSSRICVMNVLHVLCVKKDHHVFYMMKVLLAFCMWVVPRETALSTKESRVVCMMLESRFA